MNLLTLFFYSVINIHTNTMAKSLDVLVFVSETLSKISRISHIDNHELWTDLGDGGS